MKLLRLHALLLCVWGSDLGVGVRWVPKRLFVRHCAFIKDLRLLWSVDIDFSRERDSFVEVLQLWDAVDKNGVQERVEAILKDWKVGVIDCSV
eukprot:5252319-Amphidinium_carterae.1